MKDKLHSIPFQILEFIDGPFKVFFRSFGYHSESKDGMLIKYMYTNMKGEKWKKVRSMMSGVFTAGKLKHMTPFIVQCADNMEPYLDDLAANDTEFEVRDIASRFTLDAFASAGFGIENDSFKDPDNVFRKMALELVGAPGFGSSWDMPRAVFIMIFPSKCANILNCVSMVYGIIYSFLQDDGHS